MISLLVGKGTNYCLRGEKLLKWIENWSSSLTTKCKPKKIKNVLWAYQGCQSTRMDWECCANNQIEPIIKNASQFMY